MAKINGTSKADVLYGTVDEDKIYGFGGSDNLYGKAGNDAIWGGANDDVIYGESGADTLRGEDGADLLQGDNGYDLLYGATGNDGISGGRGNDSIWGGFDGDLIYGGEGKDHFFYGTKEAAPVGDREQIADFEKGDVLHLEDIDASESRAGNQAFAFIGNAGFSDAGQIRTVYDAVYNWVIIEGNVDGDFAPEFQIILNSAYAITTADIVL